MVDILIQPQPKPPYSEPQEYTHRQTDAGNHVLALGIERARMCFGVENRHLVQCAYYGGVPAVVQLFYEFFHSLLQFAHHMILVESEEDGVIGGYVQQSFPVAVLPAIFRQCLNVLDQLGVVGFVYDDFLLVQFALGAYAQQALEEVLVAFYVEHHTILVGSVDEEQTYGGQHHGAQPDTEPYSPFATLCHLLTTGIYYVVEDKYYYAHHHWHAQATLSDDGSQRCAYEEEDKARQTVCELLSCLHVMAAQGGVGAFCSHTAKLKLGLCALCIGKGAFYHSLPLVGTQVLVGSIQRFLLQNLCHQRYRILYLFRESALQVLTFCNIEIMASYTVADNVQ